jgi:hypothetical protein
MLVVKPKKWCDPMQQIKDTAGYAAHWHSLDQRKIEALPGIHELAATTEKMCDYARLSGFRPGVPGVWELGSNGGKSKLPPH